MNLLRFLQHHPDPNLRRHWYIIQVGLLLLPFSPLVGGLSILLTTIALCGREYRYLRQQPITWVLCGLAGWMLLVNSLADNFPDSLLGLYHFFVGFVVFLGCLPLFQTIDQLQQMTQLILLTGIPIVLVGLGQLFWGWAGHLQVLGIVVNLVVDPGGNPTGRMASVFSYATFLAAFLVPVFPLGVGATWEQYQKVIQVGRNRRSILILVLQSLLIVGILASIVLTSSRNAWTLTCLNGVIFALYWGWYWLVAGVLLSVGSILWSAWGPDPVRHWLRSLIPYYFWARLSGDMYPDYNVALLRSTQWQFAWTMVEQRPWLGWGLRSFSDLYLHATGVFLGHPHNLLIMLAAETGIFTPLILVSLVGWVLFRGILFWAQWPNRPTEAGGVAKPGRFLYFCYWIAFLSLTFFNWVDVTLFDVRTNLLGWMILAAILGLTLNHKRSHQQEPSP